MDCVLFLFCLFYSVGGRRFRSETRVKITRILLNNGGDLNIKSGYFSTTTPFYTFVGKI